MIGKTAGQALANCNAQLNNTRFSDSRFLIPSSCAIGQCAQANDISASSVGCRIDMTANLVDEAGRVLAVSEKKSGYFCVDSDGDGNCD
jgi:hypothetical protein